eukprot:18115-Heterococcus_DN1.PRE.9
MHTIAAVPVIREADELQCTHVQNDLKTDTGIISSSRQQQSQSSMIVATCRALHIQNSNLKRPWMIVRYSECLIAEFIYKEESAVSLNTRSI